MIREIPTNSNNKITFETKVISMIVDIRYQNKSKNKQTKKKTKLHIYQPKFVELNFSLFFSIMKNKYKQLKKC